MVLTTQLMVVLDVSIVNIALPDLALDLGFSSTSLSWVVTAYTLSFGGLLLLGARAGDIFGRGRVFAIGMAVFIAASLAGGLTDSASILLASRAVQGVGAAMMAPSALAILMGMFTETRDRTRAVGYYTAVSIGGAAVGLIAGGMLTQWVSWRWVFFVNVPIGILVLIGAARVKLPNVRTRGHVDLLGAITSTVGMTALVYGFVRAGEAGWGDALALTAFAVGLLALTAFVLIEKRATVPVVPLRLFSDRDRVAAYVVRLMLVAAMMGTFFFTTQFLQDVLNYSALATGLAFLPLTAMVFTTSQVSARVLMSRFTPKQVMSVGLTFSTAGVFGLSLLTETSSYGQLLWPLLLFGIGNGTAFVPLTSVALRGVEQRDAGAASGLVNVMQQVGGALGLAVLVTVFAVGQPVGGARRPAPRPSRCGMRSWSVPTVVSRSPPACWPPACWSCCWPCARLHVRPHRLPPWSRPRRSSATRRGVNAAPGECAPPTR